MLIFAKSNKMKTYKTLISNALRMGGGFTRRIN